MTRSIAAGFSTKEFRIFKSSNDFELEHHNLPPLSRISGLSFPFTCSFVNSPSAKTYAFSGELVLQITKDAETLCSYHALQIVPLIGGIRRDKDQREVEVSFVPVPIDQPQGESA